MPELNAATLPLAGRQLIEASAGTGKTYNITRLYLRLLLEQNLSVEQILVMTFTKAATQELRGRLQALLREAYDGWDTLEDSFFTEIRSRIDPQKARSRLHQALLHLDEATVYTIHGFCKRVLTQQAFASGISFHAEMETDSRALILEAVQDWYRQQAHQPDFDALHQFWPTPDAFTDAWAYVIATSEAVPEPQVTDPAPAWADFQAGWEAEAEAFFALNVKARRGDNQAVWQAHLDELSELCHQPWPGQAPELFSAEFAKQAFSTAKKKDQLPRLCQLVDVLRDRQSQEKAHWAWRGIEYARQHLARDKDRLNQLDFNDLIVLLRQRLQEPETGPALAATLAEQFPAALVDEFQDTDPDQYAILDAIYQQRGETSPLLCMIGDPKQAIYGFRGGDVFAYLKARDDAGNLWDMDTNFRSHPDVIRGYNRLFYGQPVPPQTDGEDWTPEPNAHVFGFDIQYKPVKAGKKDLPSLADPAKRSALQWALLAKPEDQKKGFTKSIQSELAAWTAREIQRLLSETQWQEAPVKPGQIAILVRDRNEAQTMQDALQQCQLRSVYLSARDNVMNSPEAETLFRALTGILDLENDRALVAALATPWFGLTTERLYHLQQDEHEWARLQALVAELRERWFSQGLMSMALALFRQHVHPNPNRHERALTNSLHLLELLQQASQQHRQPWALMHWFDQARQDETLAAEAQLRLESDADLIQVVTQHGAKGLEYPIVFLPFVSYGRSPKSAPMLVRYHDRTDYAAHLRLNPGPEALTWYEEEQAAEDIRLLYVAATRAELRLYMLAAEFDQFAKSPLARCLKTQSFADLTETVGHQKEEGVADWLNLDEAQPTPQPTAQAEPTAELRAATFTGRIERDWWLSSFSALTRNARHGGLSNPDRDQDEPDAPVPDKASLPLRFSLQRGAEAGNLLHDILERLDFHQPDFDAALDKPQQRYAQLLTPIATTRPQLIAWLRDILATELPGGARLADLPMAQTLRETEFYFPMAAGHSAMRELADILGRHRGTDVYGLPDMRRLKGMMHGFIDLIYHWQGRYYVVDYKSTHLGDAHNRYQDAALTESVQSSFYDLQYLLYSLALHRYLRTRLPDYDPERHLGGVQYLYLRGMTPGQTTGIYHREADLTTLAALDRLFEGAQETPA